MKEESIINFYKRIAMNFDIDEREFIFHLIYRASLVCLYFFSYQAGTAYNITGFVVSLFINLVSALFLFNCYALFFRQVYKQLKKAVPMLVKRYKTQGFYAFWVEYKLLRLSNGIKTIQAKISKATTVTTKSAKLVRKLDKHNKKILAYEKILSCSYRSF